MRKKWRRKRKGKFCPRMMNHFSSADDADDADFLVQSVIINQYSSSFVILNGIPPLSSWAKRRICRALVNAYTWMHSRFFANAQNDKMRKTLHAASLHHFALTINYQLSTKKLSIKSKDYGTKQVTLGKNPQHRNHRINRHRHHLRGDLMHRHIEGGRPALPIPSIQSVNYSVIFFVVSSFFH